LSIYGLVCLASALWSVQPSWTLYKSGEFLLDVTVLAAVLATVDSTETYETFFNWTLILCGIELLWTWMGAVIWPAEALHSTYPDRLVGVFPIQSSNAIGASGAILSVVAFCRLLPLPGCKFDRSWNILLFGFGAASMIACRTRAAFVGFALGMLLVFLFSRSARIVALVSSLLALIAYAMSLAFNAAPQPSALWDRLADPNGTIMSFMQRGQSVDQMESLTGRTQWWTFAWQQLMEHPWTGLGAYAGGRFAVLSKMGFGDTSQLHSDYLETLVGTSFWGLIPLLAGLFGTWWLLVRFMRTPSLAPFERQLALEAVAILGVITVRSVVNVEMIWHAPLFFLMVLGYAELLRRRAKRSRLQTSTV
jgi:O-antigen ligase